MRTAVSLAVSSALFAGVAFAEPATAPAATASAAQPSTAPTPAKASGVGAKTVEGLTVTGSAFPKTECSSRDQACITMVVAELKRRYPERLKRFCFQRELRDMRNGTPAFGAEHPGGASLKIACAADRK
jgi:hypothetical protein